MVKNLPANAGDSRDMGSISRSGRSTGVGNGNPLQYSLTEKFHGQRSLADFSPWGHERVRRDFVTKQLLFISLCSLESNFISQALEMY